MPISLEEFVAKRINTVCEHPKGIKGQCVCLIRCYFDEVLNLPQFPSVQSAINLWDVLDTPDFIQIPNSLFAIPQQGDIVIIAPFKGNPHGHVCIALRGSGLLSVRSFDSNWSIPRTALIEKHNYWNPRIVGWFRKYPGVTTILRVNQAIRECGDEPTRSVGTLTLSKWWQNRVLADPIKFSDNEAGYQALIDAIKWHQANHKYPHNL